MSLPRKTLTDVCLVKYCIKLYAVAFLTRYLSLGILNDLLLVTFRFAQVDQPSSRIELGPDSLDLVFARNANTTTFSLLCRLYFSNRDSLHLIWFLM